MQNHSQRLADTVKQFRSDLGLSQEKLAVLCNVDERTISNIESGRGNPHFTLLCSLVNVLQMDPREFFSSELDLDNRDKRTLHSIIDGCNPAEVDALLSVSRPVLNVLRSKNSKEIK